MRFTGLFVLALISIVASANTTLVDDLERVSPGKGEIRKIGRASCRERV